MSQPHYTEHELREMLCEIGRRVWQREYVASNDGNFSVRLPNGELLCTPTLVSKGFMRPDELPVITMDGQHIRGPKPATSEIKMHLEVYRQRPDVNSVVHVHPPNVTAFAVAKHPVPKCILPEIEVFIGEIPIAPYETPGTQIFAETLRPFLADHNVFLLTNHGAVTIGKDPFEAYYRMETIEQYCRILVLAASIGGWNRIEPDKVRDLFAIREKLGHKERRSNLAGAEICQTGVPGEKGLLATTEEKQLIESVVRQVLERIRSS